MTLRASLFACATAAGLLATDPVMPGQLVIEPPTLQCLGFEWRIEGDENRNSAVQVRFRPRGTSAWKEALPFLRVGDEQAGDAEMNYVTPRLFAGSIFDLNSDTEYEVQLTLRDPDGVQGEAVRTVVVRTRAEPTAWSGGRLRHVYPKNWKGPKTQPAYEGLLHAYYGYKRFADWNVTGVDPVQPGDTLLVHAGLYKAEPNDYRDYAGVTFFGTYELTIDGTEQKPIVIRAAGDGEAIFDGNGAHRLFDVSHADHHYFEGLSIRNTDVAIHAGSKNMTGPMGLVVRRCRFDNIGVGVQNEFAGSRNFYIADNAFFGRHDRTRLFKHELNAEGRPFQNVRSYYAVKVAGQGHVIAYNSAAYFFDGFDVSTYGNPDRDGLSAAIDIYNNDAFAITDNCFEADGGVHNVRVLRNRCVNSAQQPYTFQPSLGGPNYLIRNVGYHTPLSESVKWWGMRGAGVYVFHNTLTGSPSRHDQAASNVHFRNNIFLTQTGTNLPVIAVKTYTTYTTYDYNGYRLTATPAPAPFVWLGPQNQLRDYALSHAPILAATLEEFREKTGQERHGILLDYSDFANLAEPSNAMDRSSGVAFKLYPKDALDFSLKPGSRAVDAGVRLPNVNDNFAGKAPDLGAMELGQPSPHYGPRP